MSFLFVIPAKAGIHSDLVAGRIDSGFRRNDDFYKFKLCALCSLLSLDRIAAARHDKPMKIQFRQIEPDY